LRQRHLPDRPVLHQDADGIAALDAVVLFDVPGKDQATVMGMRVVQESAQIPHQQKTRLVHPQGVTPASVLQQRAQPKRVERFRPAKRLLLQLVHSG
jgi:hypothetical protein